MLAITAAIIDGTFADSMPRLSTISNQSFGQIKAKRIPIRIPTQINMNKLDIIAITYFIKIHYLNHVRPRIPIPMLTNIVMPK
jgi:hypothetical protein